MSKLEDNYRSFWEKQTSSKIKQAIKSWQKYFDKHGRAYALHGSNMTPPNTLADGTKVLILKEILNKKITFTTKEALEYLKENGLIYKTPHSLILVNERKGGTLCKKASPRKFLWYKEELDKLLP